MTDDNEEATEPKLTELEATVKAIENITEHGAKQIFILRGMVTQAEQYLEKARAANNDGPGSILKMVIPVLIGRKRYLSSEISLWEVILDAANAEREDILASKEWAELKAGEPVGEGSSGHHPVGSESTGEEAE